MCPAYPIEVILLKGSVWTLGCDSRFGFPLSAYSRVEKAPFSKMNQAQLLTLGQQDFVNNGDCGGSITGYAFGGISRAVGVAEEI